MILEEFRKWNGVIWSWNERDMNFRRLNIKRDYGINSWELIMEIGMMKLECDCTGRIMGVPSLFRKFSGNFLKHGK
jgi:hypothetical protein